MEEFRYCTPNWLRKMKDKLEIADITNDKKAVKCIIEELYEMLDKQLREKQDCSMTAEELFQLMKKAFLVGAVVIFLMRFFAKKEYNNLPFSHRIRYLFVT